MNNVIKNLTVCDALSWVKLVIGIGVIIAGIHYQDWMGLVGLWPITEFGLRAFHPRYKKSCSVPIVKPKK